MAGVSAVSAICAVLIVWFLGLGPRQTQVVTAPAPAPAAAKAGFDLWRVAGVTGQADSAKAPDGSNTAYKLTENSEDMARGISAVLNIDPAKRVGASLYARDGNGRRLLLRLGSGPNEIRCDVDLQSGKTAVQSAGSAQAASCKSMTRGEGWWRIELLGVVNPSGDSGEIVIAIAPTKDPFGDSYRGNGNGYILIWQAAVSQPSG